MKINMKINRILIIAAAALFLLSFFSYRNSVERAERFERGQKFLPNLNPDEIAQITIIKGEEKTQLKRADDKLVVTSAGGYPAKNEAVNRFISDILELGLEKEVGSGESLEKELELGTEDRGESTIEVVFKDSADKDMVHFLVGKAFEGGSGNYVRRLDSEDGTIYLTSSRVYFSTTADDFLDKDIVDVKKDDIAAIRGVDYQIESVDGQLKLADLPSGKKESSKVGSLTTALSGLRFQKHYLADDPAVQALRFDTIVEVSLADDSGYQVRLAESDGKHYLQIEAFHTAEQVSIARDADEEEVKETADVLARMDELQVFNNLHGSWIYEVNESTADRFRVRRSDLMENS